MFQAMGLFSRRHDHWASLNAAAIGNDNVGRIEHEITRLTNLAGVSWNEKWSHAYALRLFRSIRELPLLAVFETKDKGTWTKPQSIHFVTSQAVYIQHEVYDFDDALLWFRDADGMLLRGSELRVVSKGGNSYVFDFQVEPASSLFPERHQRALDEARRIHDLFAVYVNAADQ